MNHNWYYIEKGIIYLEWKNGYSKCLKSIIMLRFNTKRLHDNSDKQYIEIMKRLLHTCQLWILEMKNPIKIKQKELKQ